MRRSTSSRRNVTRWKFLDMSRSLCLMVVNVLWLLLDIGRSGSLSLYIYRYIACQVHYLEFLDMRKHVCVYVRYLYNKWIINKNRYKRLTTARIPRDNFLLRILMLDLHASMKDRHCFYEDTLSVDVCLCKSTRAGSCRSLAIT